MPKDILDFMEHDSSETEYIIEQLIRSDSGYGNHARRLPTIRIDVTWQVGRRHFAGVRLAWPRPQGG